MTTTVLGIIGLYLLIRCIRNPHQGIYLCVLAGMLQDPVRKMVPGQPVIVTMMVGFFALATYAGAFLHGHRISPRLLYGQDESLRRPIALFIFLLIFSSLMTIINTGSVILSGIGLISYLTPLVACLLAYLFVSAAQDIIRLLTLYVILSCLLLSGVYFSQWGFDWQLLETVGGPLLVYSDRIIALPSGFFRAPEIAAWHGGAAICFLVILYSATSNKTLKWISPLLAAFILGAVIMTGRRKILAEVMTFIPIYWLLLVYFQRRSIQLAAGLLSITAGVILVITQTTFLTDDKPVFEAMFQSTRLQLSSQSVVDRLLGATVYSFQWVVDANGVLGRGSGTGSQGAQYFGGGDALVGLASEGGLAKVLAELGVPGLLAFFFLIYRLGKSLWRKMRNIAAGDPVKVRLMYGFCAFLITNFTMYTASHQAYGDPYILVIIGSLLGFAFALSRTEVSKAQAEDNRERSKDTQAA